MLLMKNKKIYHLIYKITKIYCQKIMEFYLYVLILHFVKNLSEVIDYRKRYTFSLICGMIPRNLVGSGPGMFSCLKRLCLLLLKLQTNQIKNLKFYCNFWREKKPMNLRRTKKK